MSIPKYLYVYVRNALPKKGLAKTHAGKKLFLCVCVWSRMRQIPLTKFKRQKGGSLKDRSVFYFFMKVDVVIDDFAWPMATASALTVPHQRDGNYIEANESSRVCRPSDIIRSMK